MSTASCGRSRSGDRFYNPPAVRRQLQLQQQQQLLQKHKQQQDREEIRREKQVNYHHHELQQQQQHDQHQHQHQWRQKPAVAQQRAKTCARSAASSENLPESDDCASTATTTPAASVSSHSTSAASNLTNLDRFLEYTTPLVPAQYFSKTSIKGWRTQEDDYCPYFVLGDLWESFKEWSAYGAGVPLLLNGSDSVVQYYVPYLSGIQLYINQSKPSPIIRRPAEESDESSRETSSPGSSDCETERRASSSGVWRQHFMESVIQGMNGLKIRNNTCNGLSSDEGEFSGPGGALIFEYFEHDPPFNREPLADKISLLASRFPELRTYRSCELSPSSWISVAWYPIYRIPTGPTLQNLDSCFLTFHSLSTPARGEQHGWQCHCGSCLREFPICFDGRALKLSLPIFGMAFYKFRISVWDHNGINESHKANALLQAAGEWLRLLNVNHPDYTFFLSKNNSWK